MHCHVIGTIYIVYSICCYNKKLLFVPTFIIRNVQFIYVMRLRGNKYCIYHLKGQYHQIFDLK